MPKLNFDDNALYRHNDMMELRDETEEDPAELEAGLRGQRSERLTRVLSVNYLR